MAKRVAKYFEHTWQLWVMLLPAMIYIFIFCYVPMYGVQLAFKEYNFSKGFLGGDFVGFKYFKQYFESNMFWPTLRNTFVIAVTGIIVGFPAPIILALVINQLRNEKWKKFVQTIVYIPYFISVVVLVSMINILFASGSGVVSNFFKALHLVGPSVNIVGSAGTFLPLYVLTGVWQSMGWNSIIFIAALSSVDTQLYDACKVDGANRWQTMLNIDIPALIPTIMILLILNMGGILNVGFDKIFLMQNSTNLGVSQVISTYVYDVGVKSSQFSFGTAVGLFNTVVNFICLVITNWVSRRTTGSGLM
ncbi:carbohydrate ABC transporter membrane protein 1, CUT1 family [Butyrivibrio proteoclasticus]|uniref:Carbohydrate ABC transporter membrane protein 1, CUT1 family n=1 Tax=Butyrivibrio proteoclasticus TaxID=43305 RepID=A0A1I5UFB1_9FIRM|nr:ABC transporter permease subunit [Butyrivibrio proteoclasticus]SFP93942.1 carbohydrate ABC transporter membrane protein 1, CUT1 family [Butyrivibrio proteoclasticus]